MINEDSGQTVLFFFFSLTFFSQLFLKREFFLSCLTINELRHEKTGFFSYAKTKPQISFAVTAKLISAFVFAT